ncbi:MAG: esterase [Verrucomicrobia bacterium]|nr:esterase [Verrucomicrobiota bacterium]MBS0645158.1 esterase [Verrucomicrobiota bacterium]
MKPHKEKIGPLNVLRAGNPHKPTIVLFHGYGASADDLYSLHNLAPDDFCWIFPEGILKLSPLPWFKAYAWFEVDLNKILAQVAKGDMEGFVGSFPQELLDVKEKLHDFLNALNVPSSHLILGGFSQGAIIATELALEQSDNLAALILLSTTLIHDTRLKALAQRHAGLPFFQSHGTEDPILPFSRAQALTALLTEAGLSGHLHTFNGGHELPNSILVKLQQFLGSLKF